MHEATATMVAALGEFAVELCFAMTVGVALVVYTATFGDPFAIDDRIPEESPDA